MQGTMCFSSHVYAHITHKAFTDIPKEDTKPNHHKVHVLAFNSKSKELGIVSLDGYVHLWKAEKILSELLSTKLPETVSGEWSL